MQEYVEYVKNVQNSLDGCLIIDLLVSKKIGEGGFSKVYTAIWWRNLSSKPKKIVLKKLNGSQNMKFHTESKSTLNFYGITKDPETNEFIMIMQFAKMGSLRGILSNNFNNFLWKR